jgi:hypothetical protein
LNSIRHARFGATAAASFSSVKAGSIPSTSTRRPPPPSRSPHAFAHLQRPLAGCFGLRWLVRRWWLRRDGDLGRGCSGRSATHPSPFNGSAVPKPGPPPLRRRSETIAPIGYAYVEPAGLHEAASAKARGRAPKVGCFCALGPQSSPTRSYPVFARSFSE